MLLKSSSVSSVLPPLFKLLKPFAAVILILLHLHFLTCMDVRCRVNCIKALNSYFYGSETIMWLIKTILQHLFPSVEMSLFFCD